jgi:hypothetical protein
LVSGDGLTPFLRPVGLLADHGRNAAEVHTTEWSFSVHCTRRAATPTQPFVGANCSSRLLADANLSRTTSTTTALVLEKTVGAGALNAGRHTDAPSFMALIARRVGVALRTTSVRCPV